MIVSRTCTEISARDAEPHQDEEPRPLEAFRDAPAYVLLGDPGAGKTTAFEAECKACTDGHRTSARRFIRGHLDTHPEWRGKTLFIDGLDEVRAGGGDPRNSLDQIITKLERLGRPPFRLSCRTFDWLGRKDHKELADVYQDVGLKILQLDPLEKPDIAEILRARSDIVDAEAFMTTTQERGVDGFLTNPQSLNLLADVVTQSGEWPKSRLELFEKACLQMAREQNDEHTHAAPAPDRLVDAAGRLCAIQLMTGTEGYTRHGQPDDDYPDLKLYSDDDPDGLRPALSTMLFEGESDNRFTPVHRHIAEFLGARYLARIIHGGLPARRVIALMTGDDGTVVTELRGLSAWLAAHCQDSRMDLIERDPIGVGLYGDLRGLSLDEKRALLSSLGREGVQLDPLSDPLARNDFLFSRIDAFRERVMAFGVLATSDMEPALREVLQDDNRAQDHQVFTDFVLRVLEQGVPLPSLSETLLAIVRDDTRWPRVKESALRAFMRHCPDSQDKMGKLKDLLEGLLAGIQEGNVSDPDDVHILLGSLLTQLYPQDLPPSQVWDYLYETRDWEHFYYDMYQRFWKTDLLAKSSDDQVVELLDSLSRRFSELRPVLERHHLGRLPIKLLARGLKAHGDQLDTARLYDWLGVGEIKYARTNCKKIHDIRSWLEQRPNVQKAIILEGLYRCSDSADFRSQAFGVRRRLYHASQPPDFGRWCLKQAVARVNTKPQVAEYLFEEAFRRVGSEDLSLDILRVHAQKDERLKTSLERLLDSQERRKKRVEKPELEYRERERTFTEERQEWLARIRSNESALRENRASPVLLYQMAAVYFGVARDDEGFSEVSGLQAIMKKLEGDQQLTQAVLQGFRGAVDRQDVPAFEEILSVQAQGSMHYLAWPFLAGLAEIERTAPEDVSRWNDDRIRKALAFYYEESLPDDQPEWYQRLLAACPEVVAEVQVQFAVSKFRSGREHSDKFWKLTRTLADHAQVARHASLPLLRVFPIRCKQEQVGTLIQLLWAAIRYADRPTFLDLIERKLTRTSMNVGQRACWLTAGYLVSPAPYRDDLESFVQGQERRILHLAAGFLSSAPEYFLTDTLRIPQLEYLVRLVGRYVSPIDILDARFNTSAGSASALVRGLIQSLAASPVKDAGTVLASLLADPVLSRWHDTLSLAQNAQRIIRRDANYRHPTIKQVCHTLQGGTPANPGDLAALVLDQLSELAVHIRQGNTDDWRQYWDGLRGQSPTPRHEDDCRDALLSDLRQRLPQSVDAQPEGQYANDKRADIRVSCEGFQVPVEIKKNAHPKLWSAMRSQLIAQYTNDPDTDGYGIYLVFWFGEMDGHRTPPPPAGKRPVNAKELKKRLEDTLSADEARKISVCVIDVSSKL